MTLKEKQLMYDRFCSKMESACCHYVAERVNQQCTTVSNTFVIDEVVPEIWKHLEKNIDTLITQHSRK